eukprot:scaffold9899_cov139-Amphora_coffeaeformis.AAC.1
MANFCSSLRGVTTNRRAGGAVLTDDDMLAADDCRLGTDRFTGADCTDPNECALRAMFICFSDCCVSCGCGKSFVIFDGDDDDVGVFAAGVCPGCGCSGKLSNRAAAAVADWLLTTRMLAQWTPWQFFPCASAVPAPTVRRNTVAVVAFLVPDYSFPPMVVPSFSSVFRPILFWFVVVVVIVVVIVRVPRLSPSPAQLTRM